MFPPPLKPIHRRVRSAGYSPSINKKAALTQSRKDKSLRRLLSTSSSTISTAADEFLETSLLNDGLSSTSLIFQRERRKSLQGDGFTLHKLNWKEVKLQARQAEWEALRASFLGSCQPHYEQPTLVLLSGPAGVGKTRLGQELRTTVSKKKGFWGRGSFEHGEQVPYKAFVQACESLIVDVLEQKHEDDCCFLRDVERRLHKVVGTDHSILEELMPRLAPLFQTTAPSSTTTPSEGRIPDNDCTPRVPQSRHGLELVQSRHRLRFFLHTLCRVLCEATKGRGRPLVLLLDGIQWADPPTIDLLKALMTDPTCQSLFVMVTCRTSTSSDILVSTQMSKLVEELEDQSREGGICNVQMIQLGNLDKAGVRQVVAAALRYMHDDYSSSQDEELEDHTQRRQSLMMMALSDLVYSKTHGNVFFVTQFLQALVDQELLTFQFGTMQWEWKEAPSRAVSVTDNVAVLLESRLRSMAADRLLLLQTAACLGQTCDRETLLRVMEEVSGMNREKKGGHSDDTSKENGSPRSREETARLLDLSVADGVLELCPCSQLSFAHDQIRQVALSLVSTEELAELQLLIGQRLLHNIDNESDLRDPTTAVAATSNKDSALLTGVDLCNTAIKHVLVPSDYKLQLARYNLLAGQKAMQKAAFLSSVQYMEAGLSYLEENAFHASYSLAVALTTGAAEAAYCCGDFERSEVHVTTVLEAKGPFLDKVPAYKARILALGAQEKYGEAIETGLLVLRKLGVNFSRSPSRFDVLKETVATRVTLRSRPLDSAFFSSRMKGKRETAMGIIYMLSPLSLDSNSRNLCFVLTLRSVRWSVKYGLCRYSSAAFAAYGSICYAVLEDHKTATAITKTAMELSERLDARDALARTLLIVYSMTHHWFNDMRSCLKPLHHTSQVALAAGDIDMSVRANVQRRHIAWLMAAKPLTKLVKEIEEDCREMSLCGQDSQRRILACLLQMMLNQMDRCENRLVLSGEAMDESELLDLARRDRKKTLEAVILSYRMQLGYLYGDYFFASEMAEKNMSFGVTVMKSSLWTTRHLFFRGLTHLSMYGLGRQRRKNMLRAKRILQQMDQWRQDGNVNVLHMVPLLQAELAVARRKYSKAQSFYREAISKAGRHGFLQDTALAHTRAGLFYLQVDGFDRYWAAHHLDSAVKCYHEWGALGLANSLMEQYGRIIVGSSNASDLARQLYDERRHSVV